MTSGSDGEILYLGHETVLTSLRPQDAADALRNALQAGLDPEADPARSVVELPSGQLLVMPSQYSGTAVTKLLTVGGEPRIQGVCLVFDPETLAPAAILDGTGLTTRRTAAVSMLALRHLAAPQPFRLLVFGTGPQARAHAEAITAELPIVHQDFVGTGGHPEADELVARADIICCCTTAAEPLFDGGLVADRAAVIAIGSHEPDRRELDDRLMGRATVVVESVPTAMREAGDVIIAADAAALDPAGLISLRELVVGRCRVDRGRPRVFKSTGMAWEDAVVATAILRAYVDRRAGAEGLSSAP